MERPWQHRILIIDSDEGALTVINNFLVNEGFETITACGGEKAVHLLRSGQYDVILVDDHFADLTSSCFLKELLRIPQNAPVIVMESAPYRPCGVVPYNSLRASRLVSKWRPCEILEGVRQVLSVPRI